MALIRYDTVAQKSIAAVKSTKPPGVSGFYAEAIDGRYGYFSKCHKDAGAGAGASPSGKNCGAVALTRRGAGVRLGRLTGLPVNERPLVRLKRQHRRKNSVRMSVCGICAHAFAVAAEVRQEPAQDKTDSRRMPGRTASVPAGKAAKLPNGHSCRRHLHHRQHHRSLRQSFKSSRSASGLFRFYLYRWWLISSKNGRNMEKYEKSGKTTETRGFRQK